MNSSNASRSGRSNKDVMRSEAKRRRRANIYLAALIATPTAMVAVDALGQISLNNGSYAQNFDTLPTGGAAVTWTNNTTIPGWYMAHANGNGSVLNNGSGTSNTGGLWNFGSNNSTDRALGSIGSSNATNGGHFAYGAQFINNDPSGGVIDGITVTYTGEQWREGDTGAIQTMFFNYRVGGSTFDTPPQTGGAGGSSGNNTDTPTFAANHVSALDFNSPNLSATSGTNLDGNASGNRTQLSTTIDLSNTPVVVGSNFWVRFYNPNHPGNDHGLSVDDFQITYHTTTYPGTDTTITAPTPSYDLGRVMFTSTADVNLHKTGSQATSFSVTGQAGSNIANGGGVITAGGQDKTFNASYLGVGSFQGNITVKNLATGSAGAGQGTADTDDTINVKADVLNDRLVSATKDLGKALVGQSTQGSLTFTTTGSHLVATDVLLPESSTVTGIGNGPGLGFALAGTIFAGTSGDRHFNSDTVTETRNYSVSWIQSGTNTNTGVLAMTPDENVNGQNQNPNANITLTSVSVQAASLSTNATGVLNPGTVFTITNAVSDDNFNATLQNNFGNRASARIIAITPQESGFGVSGISAGFTTGTTIGGTSSFSGGNPTTGVGAAVVTGTVSFAGSTHLNGTYNSTMAIQFQHTDQTILGTSTHDLAAQDMLFNVTANNTVNADPHTGTYTFTGGTYVAPASITLNGKWTQSGGFATFNTFNIGATGLAAQTAGRSAARTDVIGTLNITAGGKFDTADQDLIIKNQTPAQVQALIQPAYANGAWTGSGLTSSVAAANTRTGLGYAKASDLGVGSFDSISVNPNDVLVRYTYAGDSNLSGNVDSTDFNALASHFNQTSQTWINGDFNYDGVVNMLDFNAVSTNYGATPIATPALGALVPEPAALGLLATSGLLLTRRRRGQLC